ncbi:tetratricopeptide repeat protein [uncultured Pigmentiphaga sp.]|jgi:Tfp pilus assembly protein PilF|uniref:tetratricopeptide repeat protein n=1 Tax=uncultured Pigmentiphaga sp. TaxID=340361 RepID=UPI0026239D3E|nr:tetratricopeptide repeat protein [uncultured Pigmentiphaga sp.]
MNKDNFLKLIAAGRDSALLRFTLGNLYLEEGDAAAAAEHLERAVALDASYAAAWKQLGKARHALGRDDEARDAWRRGIEAATAKGHVQAAKEMQVHLRRLDKSRGEGRP